MIETTRPNNSPVPTLVVSRPGIMQQSLRSWLASCRGIVVVATSGDGLTAMRQVERHCPEMLVIDSNLLDEEVEALLAAAKADHPALRCLVLMRSNQHEAQMMAWGADAVARRDQPAQQLHAVLTQLANISCDPQRLSEK